MLQAIKERVDACESYENQSFSRMQFDCWPLDLNHGNWWVSILNEFPEFNSLESNLRTKLQSDIKFTLAE